MRGDHEATWCDSCDQRRRNLARQGRKITSLKASATKMAAEINRLRGELAMTQREKELLKFLVLRTMLKD